jgi:sRNA-binding carbon storage regulator CsrA
MLTVTRRKGESVALLVGGKVIAYVTYVESYGAYGAISFAANRDVQILRVELIDRDPDATPEMLDNPLRREAARAVEVRAAERAKARAAKAAERSKQ